MTSDARPVAVTEVPSWRLLATLGGAGALAGLLIVLAYAWTRPPILAHRAAMLRVAIENVLLAPARADTLYLVAGALTAEATRETQSAERVYRGFDDAGRLVGYAVVASEAGFADQIAVMIGFTASTGELLGIQVMSHKETPGLGDKIERPGFISQFTRAMTPLKGVKEGSLKGGERGAIVMVTGATISSRTVVREINNAVERWTPLIHDFEATSGGRRQ